MAMTIKPIVRISDTDYDERSAYSTFWKTDIQKQFEEYAFSEELRDEIVNNLKQQAEALNQDPILLQKCIEATDQLKRQAIPCLAEKAKYQGKDAWFIVFNWSQKDDDEKLNHKNLFVIDIETQETLFTETCR